MLGALTTHRRLPLAGLVAAWAVAAIAVWIETRGQSFFMDEWNWILNRRGHSFDTFFEPHNDHLSVVPIVIYKALFETAGLDSYRPYVIVSIVFNLACGTLMYLLLRKRLGALVAVVGAALLMTLGQAWDDILWPFQIGFLAAQAAGLGALLMLERDTRRGDLAAAGLIGLSLASSGGGVAFALACAVYAIAARERVRRRLLALAVPAGLYVAWTFAYREEIGQYRTALNNRESAITFEALQDAPRLAFDYFAHAAWALSPFPYQYGPPLVLALLALLAYRLWRWERLPPGLWAVGALAFGHFYGTAVARTAQGLQSRYVYPSAVVVLLLVAYLVNRAPAGIRARVVVSAIAALALLANVGELRRAERIQVESGYVITRLAAMELVRDRVPADFQPDPNRAPDIRARPYFAAVDAFGSPAVPLEKLQGRPEPQRQEADLVLAQLLGVSVKPAEPGARGAAPLATGAARDVELRPAGGCVSARPTAPGAALEVELPPGGLAISAEGTAGAEVRVRRFADGYPGQTVGGPAGGASGQLAAPPPDRAERPWRAQVSSAEPFRICSG